ncbi:MAG TPA: hypothetical protein VKR32_17355 [Puia sp.]|nr:hypothetical protein [Puia sp.]
MIVKIDSVAVVDSLRVGQIVYKNEREKYVIGSFTLTHVFLYLIGIGLKLRALSILEMMEDGWRLEKPAVNLLR